MKGTFNRAEAKCLINENASNQSGTSPVLCTCRLCSKAIGLYEGDTTSARLVVMLYHVAECIDRPGAMEVVLWAVTLSNLSLVAMELLHVGLVARLFPWKEHEADKRDSIEVGAKAEHLLLCQVRMGP